MTPKLQLPEGTPQISLLHAFPSFALGGSQARFIQLVHALGPHFHHMITAMEPCFDAAQALDGLTNVSILRIATVRGRNLHNVPRFTRTLKEIRCDKVVTYNFGTIEWAFASALLRVPHLHVEDGFGADEITKRKLRRSLLRFVALNLSGGHLVAVSRGLSEIAKREWHVSPKKIHFVPNGIDADSVSSALDRRGPSRFAARGSIVIGTVTGLRPEKRIDRLIRAFASLPPALNAVLVIAGDGSTRQNLESLTRSLNVDDRVAFLGHVDPIHPIYSQFDVFALASDTEQMPLVVLEAMAAGLPIASTDVGDVRSMVSQPNRKWIVARSTQALARALADIALDPKGRQTVGKENFDLVRWKFSSHAMHDAWRDLLRSQVHNREQP